jgi:hypothetical protein
MTDAFYKLWPINLHVQNTSELQMDIELKQMSTDLKNTFISQHNLPVHWGTCPIISQAQQHRIHWAAVGTRRWLPWSGEPSSLPLNGLMKFPEDVTVGVAIYGLSMRMECGKQYVFVIPEDCEHQFPGWWCHLKLSLAGNVGCFHCTDTCFVSGW